MTRPVGTGPRRRPRTTALSALAVGLLVPLALAGCTPDGGASTADPDAVTTTRTDDASEDPGDAGTAGSRGDSTAEPDAVSLPAGPVTVEIAAPPLASTASGESAPAVAVAAGDEGASDVALVLADAPALVSVEDGSLVRHVDGSLTVLDDGGTPVGGFGAPRVVGPHGARPGDGTALGDAAGDEGASTEEPSPGTPGVRVVLVDARHAEVTLLPAAGTSSGTSSVGTETEGAGPTAAWDVVAPLGTQALRGTDWGEREGGRSLAVDPTAWARAAGQAGQELVWAQLVAAEPEVDTPTMHDQLVCHAVGAPDKATWNLEPWRPDVGLLATMSARCNPT
ncbi:DUF2599 domain-containing protein [Cellulosimicrobium sp. I38E]|uniref:DUF2599 domain-containing protein n=1 Tax=Cellulosimicrobium sp. I38E TaxID=1393139 RepID=UPI0007B2B85C|nr:DUF2599 domain-containing protein [Cellulosimicrobium sp. I38E]KZM79716.1 hypothetical protein A0J59_08065 [Cellulosimicrobium sp. I38E]